MLNEPVPTETDLPADDPGTPPVRPLFVVLTSLALLLVFEGLLRLLFPVPEVMGFQRILYAPGVDPELAPDLGHSADWWWFGPDEDPIPATVNLYGFRDGPWPLESDATRVAFFGDSFTDGMGAADDDTLPEAFETLARADDGDLEAMNFGSSGFGLRESLELARDAVPLFRPDHAVLVLYINDFYDPAAVDFDFDPTPTTFERTSPWQSRLGHVLGRLLTGDRLPRRWRDAPGPPRPLPIAERLHGDSALRRNIETHVDPALAAAMVAGQLNPVITDLLWRSEQTLPRPIEVRRPLAGFRDFLRQQGTSLSVVYVPSLNQVTDAYLDAQRRMSRPIASPSLTAPHFQRQAHDLAWQCAELGIPFLDTTPALRRLEASGERLYWPLDSHMTGHGYRRLAEIFHAWWRETRTP